MTNSNGNSTKRCKVERSKDKRIQLLLLDNPLKFSDSPNHVIQRNCKPSGHKPRNCIVIQKSDEKSSRHFVDPSLMLSNVMSLVPEIDELAQVVKNNNVDQVFITEIWLKDKNDVIRIGDFKVFRCAGKEREHDGVCLYINITYDVTVFDIPNENDCEVLWTLITLRRLPTGFSKLIIAALYHPSNANNAVMAENLLSSLELLESKYPDCGLIIAGYFNKLTIHCLTRQFQLKQIVNFPTQGSNKLDLFLTNLAEYSLYYENPTRTPPSGLSDHVTVLAPPKIRVKEEQSTQVKYLRDKRPSSIGRLGSFFGEIPGTLL